MLILIGRKNMTVTTTDGFRMRVRPIFTRSEGGFKQLQQCTQFNDPQHARMVLIDRFFGFRRISRNRVLEEGIFVYLREYHTKQTLSFDCYAFANLVKGVTPHKVQLMLAYWETKALQGKPKIGDVLFLGDSRSNLFLHAAIYIGFGLCISVYGGGGELTVSELACMKRDLKAKDVLVARPLS